MAESETSADEVIIRYTKPEDATEMRKWFEEKKVLQWFPCLDAWEIDDSVQRWVSFYRYRCSLSAEINGKAVGICTLYLQPYRRLMHQCEFGIIVDRNHRGKGIGEKLLRSLMKMAKEKFQIEDLCLQVYYGNPAVRLYERLGFVEYGRQDHWIKEPNGDYIGRIFMQRPL